MVAIYGGGLVDFSPVRGSGDIEVTGSFWSIDAIVSDRALKHWDANMNREDELRY
jgi:hypothetical protein